jgi:hypothetical protein
MHGPTVITMFMKARHEALIIVDAWEGAAA